MRLIIVSIFLLFISNPIALFGQQASIHAVSIGEWSRAEKLPPEYHYNSVSVFLLNEQQLQGLFDPDNFTSKQRKQSGVRSFDQLESLFFYLQMANPKEENDSIFFPLYAVDIKKLNSFSTQNKEGRIIDKITDEELNGVPLNATAKIEAIKKNKFLEVAYKLSKTVNTIVENQIFYSPPIRGALKSAQRFFEGKYQGKITSEFTIPIIPQNVDYEYVLESASIFQVKWDFQEPVKVTNGNIWNELRNRKEVTEKDLRNKPTKIFRYKQLPYLLVLRYKSAYALPHKYKLNVNLGTDYLEERLVNLQEFQKGSMQYEMEESFLTILRDANTIQRHCQDFRRKKSVGDFDLTLLMDIPQLYLDLKDRYQAHLDLVKEDSVYQKYYQQNYEVVYHKFFKLLDSEFFLDEQTKELTQITDLSFDLDRMSLDDLTTEEIYQRINRLHAYREHLKEDTNRRDRLSSQIKNQLFGLEKAIVTRDLSQKYIDAEEEKRALELKRANYSNCQLCKEEIDKKMEVIAQIEINELRNKLIILQRNQLKLRSCFSTIHKIGQERLEERFSNLDSLSIIEVKLATSYKQKLEELESIVFKFSDVESIDIFSLDKTALKTNQKMYENYLQEYCLILCQLKESQFLSTEEVKCSDCRCGVLIP